MQMFQNIAGSDYISDMRQRITTLNLVTPALHARRKMFTRTGVIPRGCQHRCGTRDQHYSGLILSWQATAICLEISLIALSGDIMLSEPDIWRMHSIFGFIKH